MARFLIKKGADYNRPNNEGVTPVQMAVEKDCGKKEGGRNPALEKWMNRAGAAALVTAAARGFIQYHALEEAVPYWSHRNLPIRPL